MRQELATIAIIVPVYNEARNIDEFLTRLQQAMAMPDVAMHVICVDDGSSDDSVARVEQRLPMLDGACIVQLSRNFGKEAALLAGLDVALQTDCDAVVMIDADLQHPPEMIPKMIEAWRQDNDVVIASRTSRKGDPLKRRLLRYIFYKAINWLAEIPIVDGDGDFRLLSRNVVKSLCSLREQHRFNKGLYSWVGFPTVRISTSFDLRSAGDTKFDRNNLIALAVNAITSFSAKPLRVVLVVGLAIGSLSLAYAVWIALQTLVLGKSLPGYASMFCGIMFLGGIQSFGIGLLGEYVGRTYIETKSRPPYIVRRVISGGGQ